MSDPKPCPCRGSNEMCGCQNGPHPAPPAVTVEAAARLLLGEWRESKTTDADEKAQDQADVHECDVDAGQIVEAWLRALAGDITPEPAERNAHRARGGYTGGV